MRDKIATARLEGFNAYHSLKEWFERPERANIARGYYTRCNKDAWQRGFDLALRTDVNRWKFLIRIKE